MTTIFQTYLSFIIACGIDSGFSRYYFKYYKKPVLTSALFSTTLLSMTAVSIFFWVILQFSGDFLFHYFFADDSFRFSEYGNLIFVNSLFTLMYTLYSQYYRDRENVRSFTTLALTYMLLLTAGSLTGLFYIGEAKGVIIGRTTGTVLTMIFFIVYFY
jgi:hypothetical protein